MRFTSELWLYPGKAAWHFVTLPTDLADELRTLPRNGFGSLRVRATIGDTTWNTSVFPDTKSGSYLLPVKAEVRRREDVGDGDVVDVVVELA